MPFDTDYIREVIGTYGAQPARMRVFRMSDFDVLVAAEVLKDHIRPGLMSHAVEVARMRVQGRDRYALANSDAPGVLQVNLDAAQRDLR